MDATSATIVNGGQAICKNTRVVAVELNYYTVILSINIKPHHSSLGRTLPRRSQLWIGRIHVYHTAQRANGSP